MMSVDVKRAYFYAPARRQVFVELPAEDWQEGDENMCGELRVSLYGTRDAARANQHSPSEGVLKGCPLITSLLEVWYIFCYAFSYVDKVFIKGIRYM